MELYGEERIYSPYSLVAKRMDDIAVAIEDILKMPDFALWQINPTIYPINLHAIRETQMGGNTSAAPNFRPYISDPLKRQGGCIIESQRVLYCADAVSLHQNRDAYTMNHEDGKNFYTTMTFEELLRIILGNGRTLHRAQFEFASREIRGVSGEIEVSECLVS